jgi:hypothetical protein
VFAIHDEAKHGRSENALKRDYRLRPGIMMIGSCDLHTFIPAIVLLVSPVCQQATTSSPFRQYLLSLMHFKRAKFGETCVLALRLFAVESHCEAVESWLPENCRF